MIENRLSRVSSSEKSCILRAAAHVARTRICTVSEWSVSRVEKDLVVTHHWFSGTRATVSSYRMQRESDVCKSVCEADALVHGCRRCRACYVCVRAQYVCVRHLWKHHAQPSASSLQGTL